MKVIVTAGPTREFIDPVRFLSNRSTGKMGYSIAAALSERGHDVILISGPVALEAPAGVRLVKIVSAEDMLQAVQADFDQCDCIVMTAAVADWRPSEVSENKLKKGANLLELKLVPTPDILGRISGRKNGKIIAGFAAETGNPVQEARRKLREKSLDVIFGNDVSLPGQGFESDDNRIFCIEAGGREEEWPLVSKAEAGRMVAEVLERLYDSGRR